MEKKIESRQFLDDDGKIRQLPQKRRVRLAAPGYLAEKFETDSVYTEKAVYALCKQWHTFKDYFILRRELIDSGLLCRKADGSEDWRPGRP